MADQPLAIVRRHALVLDADTAASSLLAAIDPAVSLVLIGEASHGRTSSIASAPT